MWNFKANSTVSVSDLEVQMNNMGNPTGSGRTPGEYSESYLTPSSDNGNFLKSSSYKNYGVSVGGVTEVGNQPKENKTSTLESRANQTQPY